MGLARDKAKVVVALDAATDTQPAEGAPSSSSTKTEIQEFLDGQGIEWSTTMTKAELLALVP